MAKVRRAVERLFGETIADAARQGPTVVLLDEVETLAADRGKLSLQTNPIDIHRAVDAVLTGVDRIARDHPSLLFIATSNVPEIVDAAFTSRADDVYTFPLPDFEAREQILRGTIDSVASRFPGVEVLIADGSVRRAAEAAEGLEGRQLRKRVAAAVAMSGEAEVDPRNMTGDDLLAAVTAAVDAR